MPKKVLILFLLLSLSLSACSFSLTQKPKTEKMPEDKEQQDDTDTEELEKRESSSLTAELAGQSEAKKIESPEELRDFLKNNSGQISYRNKGISVGLSADEIWGSDMAFDTFSNTTGLGESMPVARQESASADGAPDYSETNNQVEGVDEADIVKTDGEHIFSISGDELFIIKADVPAEAEILSKIKFDSRPKNIYINNDRLVVFGADTKVFDRDFAADFQRRSAYTYFKIFDISNPSEPSQLRDLDFEGSYSDARMIGDYVYFITDTYNRYFEAEPLLPRIMENGQDIACSEERCPMPDIYYFDLPYNSYDYTSINSINISENDSEIEREIYLLSRNQNTYVSLNNIYITYTKHISEERLAMEMLRNIMSPRLPKDEAEKIAKIDAVEDFILSEDEKYRKITTIVENYIESLEKQEQKKLEEELKKEMRREYEDISKELEKTVIHKISIKQGDIDYADKGEVTGHVLNQFSMDERDGYFRIATTKGRTWSRLDLGYDEETYQSYSNLYVLNQDMEIVGSLENLAPDERIYSVRFMQNRAYLVTFKETDPLFVIDLSSPEEPSVLGELKIPGFSNYLHPYDENTLIGVGKDAGLNEYDRVVTGGLKVSLFDVSDVKNPEEVDNVIIGGRGSDSIALRDHKAFLFSRDKNLLVIPATIRNSSEENSYGRIDFRGALWFFVSADDIEIKKRINHYNEDDDNNRYSWNGYNYYSSSVKRSLYINDTLYTLSDKYMGMNSLLNGSDLGRLELMLEKSDDFEIINNER